MYVGTTSPFSGSELVKTDQLNQVHQEQQIHANSLEQVEIKPQLSENDVKEFIFNKIKSGEAKELNECLIALDTLQKSKHLSSSMKFETQWARGEEEMKPLQYACFLGNIEVVKVLLEHGASVNDFGNTSDSTQRGSLHFALDADHSDVALLMLEKGAKDRVASCETFHAFRKYKLPTEWGGSWTCLSALHIAIIKNLPEVVNKLMIVGDGKIAVKASGSNSCLHLAARDGNEAMVKLLLSHGAKSVLGVKDQFGKTPKDVAIANKHDNLVELLTA